MRTERTAAPDGVIRERHIHEECGVFGVFARETTDVASLAYYALYALQHRGQESAGIAVNDDGVFTAYRDVGWSARYSPRSGFRRWEPAASLWAMCATAPPAATTSGTSSPFW